LGAEKSGRPNKRMELTSHSRDLDRHGRLAAHPQCSTDTCGVCRDDTASGRCRCSCLRSSAWGRRSDAHRGRGSEESLAQEERLVRVPPACTRCFANRGTPSRRGWPGTRRGLGSGQRRRPSHLTPHAARCPARIRPWTLTAMLPTDSAHGLLGEPAHEGLIGQRGALQMPTQQVAYRRRPWGSRRQMAFEACLRPVRSPLRVPHSPLVWHPHYAPASTWAVSKSWPSNNRMHLTKRARFGGGRAPRAIFIESRFAGDPRVGRAT